MKKVDRKTFLDLPDGIAFAKYTWGDNISCDDYEGLCIKVKTYRFDEDEVDDGNGNGFKKGDAFDFGVMQLGDLNSFSRDGLFDEDQVFAVFENEDVDKMIEYLNQAKKSLI